MARPLTWLGLLAGLVLGSCMAQEPGIRVLDRIPHRTDAFTQGLVHHEGRLFESTGLYGGSSLRELDPATGEVLRKLDLDDRYFGEGLALVDGQLVMLTWQEQEAIVFDMDTFELLEGHSYQGEGWGLCFDGSHLVMSDGSATLQYRDPETFELQDTITVTRAGGTPLPYLNELECVDGEVWANVFTTTVIVRIDGQGRVQGAYDLANLLTAEEWAELGPEAVLNGIAWKEDTGTFLVTGKLWPWMFELAID